MDDYAFYSNALADDYTDCGMTAQADRRRHRARTARAPGIRWPRACSLEGLSGHQQAEAAACLSRRVGLLTGTPGTGKTHVAAAICKALRERGDSVAVCAPTGKAAVRITQAMERHGVGITATTIHQLLEIGRNGHDGEGWGFQRNRITPLEEEFLIVDEASMLDTDLAAALFAACGTRTHVLLVGDPYQLPPVGHGAPLRDMIEAGVPTAKLTEIRRSSGGIVEACARIKDGLSFTTGTYDAYGETCNLLAAEHATAEAQLAAMVKILRRSDGLGYADHAQAIVATNKGPLGRVEVNKRLQQELNPHGDQADGNPFRQQDKIICLKNGWYRVSGGGGPESEAYLANGQMGRVVRVSPKETRAAFPGHANTIIIPNVKRKAGEEDEEDGASEDFALGYAITCHKAQGSEWPLVCVLVDPSPGARQVCGREWLYTAISRASGVCVLVGREGVAQMMVRRPALHKRRTFLVDEIRRRDS